MISFIPRACIFFLTIWCAPSSVNNIFENWADYSSTFACNIQSSDGLVSSGAVKLDADHN